MDSQPRMVKASVFRAWWKRLNKLIDTQQEQGANLSEAEHRRGLLLVYGERAGAVISRSVSRPVAAERPYHGETTGLEFFYEPNPAFDWESGEIGLRQQDERDPDPDALIRDIVYLTGIPE